MTDISLWEKQSVTNLLKDMHQLDLLNGLYTARSRISQDISIINSWAVIFRPRNWHGSIVHWPAERFLRTQTSLPGCLDSVHHMDDSPLDHSSNMNKFW